MGRAGIEYEGKWALSEEVRNKINQFGLEPEKFDDGEMESDLYNIIAGENGNSFIYSNSYCSLLAGDLGIKGLKKFADIIGLSETYKDALLAYAQDYNGTYGNITKKNLLYERIYHTLKGKNMDDFGKCLEEIEAEFEGKMGDDWIYAIDTYDVILGFGGNDYIYTNSVDSLVYAGGGNDIIFAGTYVNGGSGIDTIIVKNININSLVEHLTDFMKTNIEILLRADNVSDPNDLHLYTQDTFKAIGIDIAEDSSTLTMSNDWTAVVYKDCWVFESTQNGYNWHLETILESGRIIFGGEKEIVNMEYDVLKKAERFGVDISNFDERYVSYSYYQIITGEEGDSFIYTNKWYNLSTGDLGIEGLEKFANILGLSETYKEALLFFAQNKDIETYGDITREELFDGYDSIYRTLQKQNMDDFSRRLEEIEAEFEGKMGNDWIYGYFKNIILGFGGNDYIYIDNIASQVYAGSGNDIIALWSTSNYIDGGSGIDTMILGKDYTGSLTAYLTDTYFTKNNIEILLRIDDVDHDKLNGLHLYTQSDLKNIGIDIAEDGSLLTLSFDWREIVSEEEGLRIFESTQNGHDWHLETVLKNEMIIHNKFNDDILRKMENLGINENSFFDSSYTLKPLSVIVCEDGNSFIYNRSSGRHANLFIGDLGIDGLKKFAEILGLSEEKTEALIAFAQNENISTYKGIAKSELLNDSSNGIQKILEDKTRDNINNFGKLLEEIEKGHEGKMGDDFIYIFTDNVAFEMENIVLGFGGNDYIAHNIGEPEGVFYETNIIYAGSGNDIIAEYVSRNFIDGGSGIDTWIVGQTAGSLINLLSDTLWTRTNIEILLKADGIKDPVSIPICNQSDLKNIGVNISEDGSTLTISNDWKAIVYSNLWVFESSQDGYNWHLETILNSESIVFDGIKQVINMEYDAALKAEKLGIDTSVFHEGIYSSHFISADNRNSFIYTDRDFNLIVSDIGLEGIKKIGEILEFSQYTLDCLSSAFEKGTSYDNEKYIRDNIIDALKKQNINNFSKLLENIEKEYEEKMGDDFIFNSIGNIVFSFGGNDYIQGSCDYVFSGSGNDIISRFNPRGDYIDGGSGIDILFTGSYVNYSLLTLLYGTVCTMTGIEILLKVTDIQSSSNLLYTQDALKGIGIDIAEDGSLLTLSADWTEIVSEEVGLRIFESTQNGHDWHLETVLPDEQVVHLTGETPATLSLDFNTNIFVPDAALDTVLDIRQNLQAETEETQAKPLTVQAEAGNDIIIVEGIEDKVAFVDGGDGLDILLGDKDKVQTENVEVYIKGYDANDLTSMADLVEKGITVKAEENKIELDEELWQQDGDVWKNGDIILEVEDTVEVELVMKIIEDNQG